MPTTIGSANLILSADPQPLEQDLSGAQNTVAAWTSSIVGSIQKMATLSIGAVAGLAAGFATTFFAPLFAWHDKINGVFDSVGEISKVGKRFNLSVTQMQTIMAGARLDAETLSTSLTHLARATGDVALGSASARRSFQRLGISADDLRGRGVDEQFRLVANQLSHIEMLVDW